LILRYSDCSTEALPIDTDGVVFSFANQTKLANDVFPAALTAYNAGGQQVAHRDLPVRLIRSRSAQRIDVL
jgi:hypothetical protein